MTIQNTFASLGLAEPILRAVSDTGYTTPTPIQAQAIPLILAGGDLLAAAQTGTGKTAGFTLPVLHLLASDPPANQRPGRPRCLVLTPTRELAAQVQESVETYGKHLQLTSMVMFGGVNINPQFHGLRKRVDILVATPGRLLDHVGQKTLDLSGVEILILDEADRMLDMGFIRDIRKILALLPRERQNLLFSATFSDDIRELANNLLDNPACVEVARRNTASELVSQSVYMIGQKQKRELLAHLVKQNDWQQVLVFTRTKHGANKLAEFLVKQGIASAAIHGNKSQAARTRALALFKDGALPVLVATDIAARGLDIDQLPHVINFELPNIPEDYVHRIGRTGRAGSTGHAISLVDVEETKHLAGIERLIKHRIERVTPVDFVPSKNPEEDAPRPPQGRAGHRTPRRAGADAATPRARSGRGDPRGGPRPTSGQAPRAQSRQGEANGNRSDGPRREVDGNRLPPQRADVDGNRIAPPRSAPNGNTAPRRGEGDSRRRSQPAALFSARTGSRNR